jgi:hypothetical protein
MVSAEIRRGFYSIVRWRTDVARDEARNIAVVLADADGAFSKLRSAPLSVVSPRLHEQGLLDAMLVGLERRLDEDGEPFTADQLYKLHQDLHHSVYVTEPKPVAVGDPDAVLTALYRAFVATRGGGRRGQTKGMVLDKVVSALRTRGMTVRRGAYVEDFIFDVIIDEADRYTPVEVLSFAAPRKDWSLLEKDAGHFLFALDQLSVPGAAVVQPPPPDLETAVEPYARVRRWFDAADVPVSDPDGVTTGALVLDLGQ